MAKYLELTHNRSEIGTVGDLFSANGGNLIIVRREGDLSGPGFASVRSFLDYNGGVSGGEGTNFERILRKHPLYSDKVRNRKYYDSGDFDKIELLVGTLFLVPITHLNSDLLFRLDNNVITLSGRAFMAKALKDLLEDPDYTQVYDAGAAGSTSVHNSDITVRMWLRAVSPVQGKPMGSWVDASSYVVSLTTAKGKTAGGFSLELSGAPGSWDEPGGWHLSDDPGVSTSVGSSFPSDGGTLGDSGRFFFHDAVQENDIVYIRFEELLTERKKGTSSSLAGKVFDMIGMVDKSFLSHNYSTNDVTVTIEGRDLMKVFIEDGSYFFPAQYATDMFANNGSRQILERVSVLEGGLESTEARMDRSILFTLQFVMTQLGTTGYVPDGIFSSEGYAPGDLSSTFIKPGFVNSGTDATGTNSLSSRARRALLLEPGDKSSPVPQPGIWQIISLLVDPSVASRRLTDSSISQEQGSMINSIKKICQEPFVEFFGDTYGDRYVFTARVPPFDKTGALSMIYGDVKDSPAPFRPFPGGHVPPPPDVSDVFAGGMSVGVDPDRLSPITLDINDRGLLSMNLCYSNEAYSWYQIIPSSFLFGQGKKITLAYIPAISFDEYAEVFGSRPFSKESLYVPYRPVADLNQEKKDTYMLRQVVEDLKYIISSHQYLPFTRRGTITVNGNRTFKVGTFVRLRKTNEVFHVDSVENNWSIDMDSSIDRVTTLTVSRGMVEPYIKGVRRRNDNGGSDLISYFNIIDLPSPEKLAGLSAGDNAPSADEYLKNWKVNPRVFDFFLKRGQWG